MLTSHLLLAREAEMHRLSDDRAAGLAAQRAERDAALAARRARRARRDELFAAVAEIARACGVEWAPEPRSAVMKARILAQLRDWGGPC